MKISILFLALTAAFAQAAPADEIRAAAAKLAEAPSYSWTRSEIISGSGKAVTEGMAEKDGFIVTQTSSPSGAKTQNVFRSGRMIMLRDNTWITPEESRAAFV